MGYEPQKDYSSRQVQNLEEFQGMLEHVDYNLIQSFIQF